MTQRQSSPPPLVQGSWEELVVRGQQLLAQQHDEGIPILQKVVDRLSSIPKGQRAAANNRLNDLLWRAALDLQYAFNARDRYQEALAVNRSTRNTLPAGDQLPWDLFAATIRIQAGEVDAGLAAMRDLAAHGDLTTWGEAFYAALTVGRLEDAVEILHEAEQWRDGQQPAELASEATRAALGLLAFLKARFALAQGQFDEGLAWFDQASALDQEFARNPQLFYTHLMDAGAYRQAQRLIATDQDDATRAGFWQGLLYMRRGQLAEAEQQWRHALRAVPEEGKVALLELVLAHYYLGDKEGAGLGSALKALKENRSFWGHFYLAGLGWALRGDVAAARTDMQAAQMRRKALAQGRKLANNWWQFCADLLDADRQAALVEYFEDAQVQRHA